MEVPLYGMKCDIDDMGVNRTICHNRFDAHMFSLIK